MNGGDLQTGYFIEEQRMDHLLLKLVLYGVAVVMLGLVVESIWVQLIQGRPFGNKPLSNGGLIFADLFLLLTGVFFPLAILRIKMVVTVEPGRIFINYWPLKKKEVLLSEVVSWEAMTYRPIRDYGGWGIKYSLTKKTWAYNVGGDRGVLVTLADGSKIMIGSERAEELASAIAQFRSA